jgi:1,2-diacylglycerol 3-alpha-glucosyltransferase
MQILMFTNTYRPHVGGVANSVHTFAETYRAAGHNVTVVAPEFEGAPEDDTGVIRVPAIQHFNGSDFSVCLAIPPSTTRALKAFEPDIIHSHHPFLLGDTALRLAENMRVPLVFTYHTMYELYTNYVPADSEPLRRFAKALAATYCNLSDQVIAPSESIRQLLIERDVETPVTVAPTGIDPERFAHGDGAAFRKRNHIPSTCFVAGHVGRLAPEKNGGFLADALAGFIREDPETRRALIVGSGPSEDDMQARFEQQGVAAQAVFAGQLTGQDLADAYAAMDVFGFASTSETQGMVIAEAMAAGNPVVALDAPGAREIVKDGHNGRLVVQEDAELFREALRGMAGQPESARDAMRRHAVETGQSVSADRCAERVMEVYEKAIQTYPDAAQPEKGTLDALLAKIKHEWDIWSGKWTAIEAALATEETEPDDRAPS